MRKDYSSTDYAPFKTLDHLTRAGDFEMIIHGADYDTSGATEGYIQVEEVGDIKYEFDVPDNEEDPKSIQMNSGSIDVTVWDKVKMEDGSYRNLHEQLYNADPIQFPFEVTINITKGGTEYNFSLQFDYEDIDYDYVTRKIELQLATASNFQSEYSPLVEDFVVNAPDYNLARYPFIETDVFYTSDYAVAIYPMIEQAIQMLNPDFPVEISTDNFPDQTIQSSVTYFLTRPTEIAYYGEGFTREDTTIFDQMAYLAALEGSFYGQGFNRCFYTNRTNKDSEYQKDIPFDEIEELEIVERRNSNLLYVESNVLGRPVYPRNAGEPDDFNDEWTLFESDKEYFRSVKNDKFFSSSHPLGFVSPLGMYLTGAGTDQVTFSDPNDHFSGNIDSLRTTLYQDVATSGLEAYKRAVGASHPLRIKITGWDIFKLRPYEWFTITGSGTPSLLSGKDFRISEISYNLRTDKYEVEAYQF